MNYPRFKLFCLPFSGAGSYSYQVFEKQAPSNITIEALELPGRGSRVLEPLLDNIKEMAEDIFQQIKEKLHTPYAIYGHSLGTLLAYQVTHLIRQAGLPLPVHIFVTGRSAPSIPYKNNKKHLLPPDEFLEKLREMGGSPPEVLADKTLMSFFAPIIRADFKAAETFVYKKRQALPVPIDVMAGREEDISFEDMIAWQRETTEPVEARFFTGNHFFIFDHAQAVLAHMVQKLNAVSVSFA